MAQTQTKSKSKEIKDVSGISSKVENSVKKIVIRRLPPSLTKEQFLEIVSPLPEYDYFCYANADLSLGQFAFCRAYICFKSSNDIFSFRERFDNYVFVDAKSNEYPAVVEYAPYQRRLVVDVSSSARAKKDSRLNTIDQDAEYIKFVEALSNKSSDSLPTCEAILEELEQRQKEKLAGASASSISPRITTPLIEFMRQKHQDKKKTHKEERGGGEAKHSRKRDRGGRRDRDGEKKGGGSNKRYANKEKETTAGNGIGNFVVYHSNMKNQQQQSGARSGNSNGGSQKNKDKEKEKPDGKSVDQAKNNQRSGGSGSAGGGGISNKGNKSDNNYSKSSKKSANSSSDSKLTAKEGSKLSSTEATSNAAASAPPTTSTASSAEVTSKPSQEKKTDQASSNREEKIGGEKGGGNRNEEHREKSGKKPPIQIYDPAERIRQRQQKQTK